MSTRFQSKGLEVLQRLYNFVGQLTGLDRFELDLPIQPVHDVRREKEVASGIGFQIAPGWWLFGIAHVHAAGGETVRVNTNPRVAIAAASGLGIVAPAPFEFDVWCAGVFTFSGSIGIQTSATVAVRYPLLPGTTTALARLLSSATTATPITNVVASADEESSGSFFASPFLIPLGATFDTRTVATVATPGTIFVGFLCWIGPKGVLPPGMA